MTLKKKPQIVQLISASELSLIYYDNSDIKILLKVSASTIYRWRAKKILKYCKIGSKYFYPKAVIERMMKIRNE